MSNNPSGRPRSDDVTASLHWAVFRLLESRSYASLTMEGVAEAAGVSRPALYRRYRDVGRLTLGALIAFGDEALPISSSTDITKDLCAYFGSVIASLHVSSAAGRALRGVLAQSLIDLPFGQDFSAFLTIRREPVRSRLLQWRPSLSPSVLEFTLDLLFGPVLYRLLIRQERVRKAQVKQIVCKALELLE